MKAILEFNLPDEDYEFKGALKGSSWRRVVTELHEYLRRRLKYEELSEEAGATLTEVREELFENLNTFDVDVYED